MFSWTGFFTALALGFLAWSCYRYLKANPQLLSKANVLKSMSTMAYLALGLIAFISLLVWMLNQGG